PPFLPPPLTRASESDQRLNSEVLEASTWKRSYGLRRMGWRGLAKACLQVHLTAIAYNLKRTANILGRAAA
ncbi:transposase, partial [Teichococcus wenyumeiae]|uniref:transposase n=1 Tax=Teichococcus wenyumeiae TaxID=2478470 RepID=UPI001F2859CD